MRRLGEILLERGAIAVAELHTGLEACRRSGGRLGTHLLRYGFVDEHTLLEALSEQFGVPSVGGRVIEHAPPEVRRAIPLEVLQRAQAAPFERSAARLRVAMINPRDPAAVDELNQHSPLPVEVYVGIETAIAGVLRELEEGGAAFSVATAEPSRAPGEASGPAGWEELWTMPQLSPDDLLGLRPAARAGSETLCVATFPGLSRVVDGEAADAEEVVDEGVFVRRLQRAEHRDDIGEVLLRYVVGFLHRLALFTVHKGQVAGWLARGQSVVVDDVQTFAADVTSPSVFRDVIESGRRHSGALLPSAVNQQLVEVLGEPAATQLLVAPVQVKGRTVACLVGDVPGEEVLAVPEHEILGAVRRAGIAFEMLIMRHKISA